VRQANANGGINGHEVVLDFCNENLNPNTARNCARQMVSDHVIAMADTSVITAEADAYKILGAANIANVGPVSFSGAAATDPDSYLIRPDENYSIASLAQYSVSAGDKKIALALLDSPLTATYKPLLSKVAPALGGQLVTTVTFPQVTSDVSTQAEALMSASPDAVMLQQSPAAALPMMKDMDALGYKGKFLSDGAQFTASDLAGLGSVANQLMFTSPFPPATDTSILGIKEFRAAMTAEKAAGDTEAPAGDAVESYDIQAWADVTAIQRIANASKATDAASFKTAIDATKDLNLDGVVPPWTPNESHSGAPEPRVNNGSFYEYSWDNGKAVIANSKQIDVTTLINKYFPS
jgi:branched-chain amino acid transport system substrate-binding protein